MVAICHLGFLKVSYFDQLVSSGGLIYAIMQNFVEIGQTVSDIWRLFIFKMVTVILYFVILKFLVDRHIGWPNVHRRTKFHQNRSNGCWDIAFYNFQNGGRPLSWIFITLIFWTFLKVWWDNVRQHAKFHWNRSNRCWNIAIYPFFSRSRPSAIFDLWGKFWDDPQRDLVVFIKCAKFGYNRISFW